MPKNFTRFAKTRLAEPLLNIILSKQVDHEYAWELILAPDVNDSGHVALFAKPKKVNSRGHIPERLVGQREAKLGLAKTIRIFLKIFRRWKDIQKDWRFLDEFGNS